jgi:cytochrome c oxidase subunit III
MASHAPDTLAVDAPHGHGHHAPGHDHPPHLQHHFVSSEQQFDAAKLGMWLFLMTEILLFSGMFVAYTVYRVWHPEVFEAAAHVLDTTMGAFNTLVLLASSLTMALAINRIQHDDRKGCTRYLALTLLGALIFLVVKYFEYTSKFHGGVYAGTAFNPTGEHYGYLADVPYAQQFFSIYYMATGIHASHILVGMGILIWVMIRNMKGHFSSGWYTPVELGGLFWHLVDIIWIFLFPLLYLIH